jgi:hypothetical protein
MKNWMFVFCLWVVGWGAFGAAELERCEKEKEKQFSDPSTFSISIQKDETEWHRDRKWKEREVKKTEYILRLKNAGEIEMSGLRMEACSYGNITGTNSYISATSWGEKLDDMGAFSTQETKFGNMISFRDLRGNILAEHKAVRIKIILSLSDGRELVREACYPETLSTKQYLWKAVGAGLYNAEEIVTNVFMDSSVFKISADQAESEWVYDPDGSSRNAHRVAKKTDYIVRLENRGTVGFTGLRIDCRTYRMVRGEGEGHVVTDFQSRPVGEVWSITTNLFCAVSYSNQQHNVSEEVLGARIRVVLTLSDGKEIFREITVPEKLSSQTCPWVDFEEERIVTFNSPSKEALFLDTEALKFSIKKVEGEWSAAPRLAKDRMVRPVRFILQMENTNSVAFRDLRMEYCVYVYSTSRSKNIGCVIYPKREFIGTAEPGIVSQVVFDCPADEEKTPSIDFGREVVAGRFRIYMLLEDQREVMREIQYPESLSEELYPWKASLTENTPPYVIPFSK